MLIDVSLKPDDSAPDAVSGAPDRGNLSVGQSGTALADIESTLGHNS